ncbi:antiviral reverse transcriptase Drt3b [Devosia sp. A369]
MPRKRKIQSTFDRNDLYRALITDTAPGDAPLVYSNDGFRSNMLRLASMPADVRKLVDVTIIDGDVPYTVPFRYKISHKEGRLRQLSLVHPSSQVRAAEFYNRYDHLITYYASRSPYSIRFPSKVASTFFYQSPIADLNKFKKADVIQDEIDGLVRNPSSYFAYGGYVRFHKFFASEEYIDLEKRFSFMSMLDVSKCFSSIYTHTITWAVKDLEHGKDNNRAISFGNDFDRLMQKMNYNETNGIVVGSEVSRVCAEIVLQSVDSRLHSRLHQKNLLNGVDYSIKRYVDDYIVFSNSEARSFQIERLLADELEKINLHLNEEKAERLKRPFQTKMSAVSDWTSRAIERFWLQHTVRLGDKAQYSICSPRGLSRRAAGNFVREIKTLCHESGAEYGHVSSIIISAMESRIQRVIDSVDKLNIVDEFALEDQYKLICALLDIMYFFYSVHPTVASSYKVAKATILCTRFVRSRLLEYLSTYSEFVLNLALSFFDRPFGGTDIYEKHVPIEQLNILLAVSELQDRYLERLRPTMERCQRRSKIRPLGGARPGHLWRAHETAGRA